MLYLANRSLACFLTLSIGLLVTGCSNASDSEAVTSESNSEVVDGGTDTNADRDRVQEYFDALAKVQSAQEEEVLVTDLAAWLNKHDYKIQIEQQEGKHVLSCPYFPPVTPWTSHSFYDVGNLDLLSR